MPPPAENGTISEIGRLGQSCAEAVPTAKVVSIAVAVSSIVARFIAFS
jgi:hypothetical protein